MVNVTYTVASHDISTTTSDGTEVIYNLGDMAWVITATALVWIMIPGLGFFYGGLLRRKNALSMLWMSLVVSSIVFFQWFFWGFSLSFSQTSSNSFIGNLAYFGFMNVDIEPSSGGATIPQLLYALYQGMFAAITPVIACGAFADRARMLPVMIFVFCWSTIVYNPIAYGTWNVGHGWMNNLGGLDFAGGSPVHISSGTAALAISIFLGRRKGYGTEALAYRPHNVTYVVLGTALLWFGWNGFNGGSAIGANLRAVMAMTVTNISASVGGLTWMLWDYRLERRWSAVGFCSGAIAGLVAITPGSGYVGAPAAVAFGVVGATASNWATAIKGLLAIDDTVDAFAAHAIGGLTGNILTAFFADSRVASFDGSAPIAGGWINHHWVQLGYQLADSAFTLGWSFVVTMILLFAIDRIPGCHFRASDEDEAVGMDLAQVGEPAYVLLDSAWHSSDDIDVEGAAEARPTTKMAGDMASSPSSVHAAEKGAESDSPDESVQATTSPMPALAHS
ncbi:high affinity ammonium transporter [Jaminaea rosea]|uniref:Ammonium transporter n=1 Tax=Jaminaea rosea TaxID=1569628 RepID=A0A316V256_9BASI|nr:high affinity ammonium transporter [Jaminaea rosea]PWN29505.1 high affinity ammonium transporter [Jaminaea rosea]